MIAEWDSVAKQYPNFQQAFMNLEALVVNKCNLDWSPKRFNLASTYGSGESEYGRTTILPGAFDDHLQVWMQTFRQSFTAAYLAANPVQFTLMAGVGAGNTIPEDCKIALMGFAFPNKQQHITEIKMQIADRKFGRFNLEEMQIMNKPAIIFEEGFVLDEEEAFDLYCHMDTTGFNQIGAGVDAWSTIYQRVVPIGALYYKYYNKVGGNTGTAIPTT